MPIHGNQQSRKYQLTLNNPEEKGLTHTVIKEKLSAFKSLIYYCMADEQAQQHHTHLFLAFSSPVRFSQVKSHFKQAHIEKALGTSQENRDYILKAGKWENSEKHGTVIEGSFEEWGTCPEEQQGKRSDLALMYSMIKDGASDVQILEENASFIRYIGHIEKVRQALAKENKPNYVRDIEVCFVFGAGGTKKLKFVFDKFGFEQVFRVTDYQKHSFDGYNGETVMCFDNFQDGFSLSDMLNLYMCGLPLQLSCRYLNKTACYTTLVIVSRKSPEDLYLNGDSTDKKEFYDKLNTIIQFNADGTVSEYTNSQYFDLENRLSKDSPFK